MEEDGEVLRQRGDCARLFSLTVWPTGAGPPLLCVGSGEREGGRQGGREGRRGRGVRSVQTTVFK